MLRVLRRHAPHRRHALEERGLPLKPDLETINKESQSTNQSLFLNSNRLCLAKSRGKWQKKIGQNIILLQVGQDYLADTLKKDLPFASLKIALNPNLSIDYFVNPKLKIPRFFLSLSKNCLGNDSFPAFEALVS